MNTNAMSKKILMYICLTACVFLPYKQYGQNIPIDGFGNNLSNPEWGAVDGKQERLSPAVYQDGISIPVSGAENGKPHSRKISNDIFAQSDGIANNLQLSDFVWGFGQFIDHDIVLSPAGPEFSPIVVQEDDEHFSAGDIILFSRSEYDKNTGEAHGIAREYLNKTTAFIDGSAIYGPDTERASWLRTYEGGKLKVSQGNLLPWNTLTGEFNDPIDPSAPHMDDDTRLLKKYYVAGDVRANENPVLAAIHTLFVREHNRLCDDIAKENPDLKDEEIYQVARDWVVAYMQNIAFNEWLPAMGINLPDYVGYEGNLNPNIINEFSTAAYRLGHTLINGNLIRMNNGGSEISRGNISLKDAFFNPHAITLAGGIDPYLKGMATQMQQEFDCKIIDDLRNFLFGNGGVGLDLVAINIERGRDRGIPDYNSVRVSMGMPKVKSFVDITKNAQEALDLKNLYGDIDNVDAWVGMLAEAHVHESLFGELVTKILIRQFRALRNGDRFYFENRGFSPTELKAIKSTRLSDILMRNTDITLMQDNVFLATPHNNIEGGPELIEYPLSAALYPNPVVDETSMKIFLDVETTITISVFDSNGNKIMSRDKHMYKGNNIVALNEIADCQAGLYNVLVESGNRFTVLKMIKL